LTRWYGRPSGVEVFSVACKPVQHPWITDPNRFLRERVASIMSSWRPPRVRHERQARWTRGRCPRCHARWLRRVRGRTVYRSDGRGNGGWVHN
jgi:hypothetical protein